MPQFLTLEGRRKRRQGKLTLASLLGINLNDEETETQEPIPRSATAPVPYSPAAPAPVAPPPYGYPMPYRAPQIPTPEGLYPIKHGISPGVSSHFVPAQYGLPQDASSPFAQYGVEISSEEDLGRFALMSLGLRGIFPSNDMSNEDLRDLGGLALSAMSGRDQGLAGWFKRIFTPPRAVRSFFARVTKPGKMFKIKKNFVNTSLRYIGAGASVFYTGGFLPAKTRNKAFGLKGPEAASFSLGSRIMQGVTISAASIIGGPAILGSLGSKAALGLKTAMSAKMGGKFMSSMIGGNKGSFMIKDQANDALWSITKNTAGQLIGNKYDRSQLPANDYASMPDGVPVPSAFPVDSQSGTPYIAGASESGGGEQRAPFVAGSSGLAPGGDEYPPQRFGQMAPYDPSGVNDPNNNAMRESALDPKDSANISPAQGEAIRNSAEMNPEEPSMSELISRGKTEELEPKPVIEPEDLGLKDLIAYARPGPRSSPRRKFRKYKPIFGGTNA